MEEIGIILLTETHVRKSDRSNIPNFNVTE